MSKRAKKRDTSPEGPGDPVRRHEGDADALRALRDGDGSAIERLVTSWIDDVNDHLSRVQPLSGDPTTHAIEIFRSARQRVLDDRSEPFGTAVMAATIATVGRTSRRIDSSMKAPARSIGKLSQGTDAREVAADATVRTVLQDAASVLGDDVNEVLDLHWRHGLDAAAMSVVLGVPMGRVSDIVTKAPSGLAAAVRTRLLWSGGEPDHDELARQLADASITSFSPQTVRVIHKHVQSCAACRSKSLIALPVIDVFAAIPLEPAGDRMRTAVIDALKEEPLPAASGAARAAEDARGEGDEDGKSGEQDEGESEGAALAGAAAAGAAGGAAAAVLGSEGGAGEAGKDATDEKAGVGGAPAEGAGALGTTGEDTAGSPGSPGSVETQPAAAAASTATGSSVHQPVAGRRDDSKGRSKKAMVLVGGIAAALLIVIIVIAVVARGGDDGGEDVQVASASDRELRLPSSTTTSTSSTTTTTLDDTTTSSETTIPAIEGPSTTATTLPFPDFPTTAPPTTRPGVGLHVTFRILGGASGTHFRKDYAMGEALLTWEVTADVPVGVEITGEGVNMPAGGPSGTVELCPRTPTLQGICPAPADTYWYTLVVVFDGRELDRRSLPLIIG